jgi:hypothetical protein
LRVRRRANMSGMANTAGTTSSASKLRGEPKLILFRVCAARPENAT